MSRKRSSTRLVEMKNVSDPAVPIGKVIRVPAVYVSSMQRDGWKLVPEEERTR
jgi:hypothetical protein